MSLSEETLSLQRAAHDLMYLGMDAVPSTAMIFPVVMVRFTV